MSNPKFSRRFLWTISCVAAFCFGLGAAQAEVRLPGVFSSHMVLQREKPLIFWGWAEPGEFVTVRLADGTQQTKANDRGEWKVVLPAVKAGGPFQVTVTGSNTVQFEDVLIGDVWLCSGQSNMEMGIGSVKDGKQEIAQANHSDIRLLMVPNRWTAQPQTNIDASWKVCTPEAIAESGWGGFSAAAYFFGRELQKQLGVPQGLIDATWGGTRIESWTPPDGFAAVPALKRDYDLVQLADPRTTAHEQRLGKVLDETQEWLAAARKAMKEQALVPTMPTYPSELLPPHDVQNSTALFNGMISPLCPFALRGAIWYQGESNLGEGMLYCERMKALVSGWRQIWGEGEFPFYFVQIAPFNYGGNPEREPELWESQAAAARLIPNAGMAVVNDIGDLKDIHPTNKQEVGRRLALLALAGAYGRSEVTGSGPIFQDMKIEGDKLRLAVQTGTAKGLASRDGQPLNWFEMIDADEGPFVQAKAQIDGDSIVLSAPEVKHPVAMRFAWSMLAEPNLVNAAGLPAGAFRAGNVPKRDLLVLKVPEAKDYQLVYDLDLGKLGPNFSYDVDNSSQVSRKFDRIAYFLELQGADGDTQYVYASMDAFTDDLVKIGVPTFRSGARFQQPVANLNVYSNGKGIVSGIGLPGGNVEFWPQNYGAANSANVPNASGQVYDFGDEPTEPAEGYGSMQIHNHDAKQTLFALNHWGEGSKADLGIGNQPQGNPDWTFAGNAGSYVAKRLRVLVHCR
jgi:sialate O-acetylesterase